MKRNFLNAFFVSGWVLLVALSLQSCSDSGDPVPQDSDPILTEPGTPQGTASEAVIGASGGSLTSADGHLTVTIPEGALASNTTISIQPLSNNAPLGLGTAYRLSPEGTTFSQPVMLTFHYDNQILGSASEEFLWITTQNPDGTWSALLKSETDLDDDAVTVTTTHFSDWALGRFVDFVLEPAQTIVAVNKTVNLKLTGFLRDKEDPNAMDELAPLIPLKDDGLESLTPLTPIPRDIEKRMIQFRATKWTLNGATAPVSNTNGKLSASGNGATYTAPSKAPNPRTVAVSVELETTNKEGSKGKYMVVSNITVLEDDYYLELTVDGQTYVYYQYGFNGQVPEDENNFEMVNCGPVHDDTGVGISAGYMQNSETNKIFLAAFTQGQGTHTLKCIYDDGDDDVAFTNVGGTNGFAGSFVERTKKNDVCDVAYRCASFSYTLTEFTGGSMSDVVGYFSGTVYEDTPELEDNCQTPTPHQISGVFRLVYAKL